MAHAAGDAHELPIYGAHFRATFPILDADGDLVTAAGSLDSEVSKDSGTFADCTNEATEVATSSGMYFLDLTGAEMEAKVVAVIVKSAGGKTTPMVLYPKRLSVLESGTAAAGAAGTITLASGASAVDEFYAGCYVHMTNNSPSGVQYQVRRILSYVGSTKVATVDSNWGTNPSNASTYNILIPESVSVAAWAGKKMTDPGTAGVPNVDLARIVNAAVSTSTAQLGVNAVQAGGTAWGSGAITANSIASDAITDAKVASDVTIASVTGAVGSVTAGVTLANDAITAAKFDETTAFPLKADDAGSTQVARVGADGDTLETLSDQLDTKASQASVDDLPTNAELATSQAAADDATLAAIAALNNLSTAQVNAEVDSALADYDAPTKAELDSAVAPLALEATLGTPAGDSLSADIAAIEAQTDDIGVAGAGLTALASAANLAIVAGYLDTEIAAIKAVTDKVDDTLEDDAGTYRFTTNALEQAPTGGSAPTAADIADAVWEEAIADHSGTAGSTAEALADAGGAGTPPTAGEVADAVWDEARADHVAAGSFGQGVGLADDAITAGTFDETTAFPVTSADTGATQLARVGADGDTLETLSDQLDTKASQSSVDDLPTTAELATALGTADDAVLVQVALVKAQTDKLTFDADNVLDANLQKINDVELVGDGDGTPFTVA